jgi:hypothetical protein
LRLPAEVGPFHRQWIDHRDDARNAPVYAQYESPDGEVFVELGIQDDPVDARRGIQTAKAEIEAGTSQALSLDAEPSYFHAVTSRGAFFAWTRGAYFLSAHARGGQEDLDRFMQAFPY